MSDPHGVDRVDTITAFIDEALSGYETQRAGDYWYDGDDDDLPQVNYRWTGEQLIADTGGPYGGDPIILSFATSPALRGVITKDTDPLRLSNNWADRAFWAWDWADLEWGDYSTACTHDDDFCSRTHCWHTTIVSPLPPIVLFDMETDPLRLSNNWVDRAYWMWDWAWAWGDPYPRSSSDATYRWASHDCD